MKVERPLSWCLVVMEAALTREDTLSNAASALSITLSLILYSILPSISIPLFCV
jgi:hypothetical protein